MKSEWRNRFPIGARVKILASDLPCYVGTIGTVRGYDDDAPDDETPLVSVAFDAPIEGHDGDGFYDDEIERVTE